MAGPWTSLLLPIDDVAWAESEVAWSRNLMNESQSAYETALDNSKVSIREVGEVDLNKLSTLIKGSGGALITSAQDELVGYAQSRWWQFSVTLSTDGRQARITENNYLLYGGIAAAALLLITFLGSR